MTEEKQVADMTAKEAANKETPAKDNGKAVKVVFLQSIRHAGKEGEIKEILESDAIRFGKDVRKATKEDEKKARKKSNVDDKE